MDPKRHWRRLVGLLAAAALLSWGGAAAAEARRGEGLIVAKNVREQTLSLDGGVVLQVTERTRIEAADGRRLGFGDLVAGAHRGPFVEAVPGATIRYEASSRGHTGPLRAEWIRVGGGPAR